MITRPLAQGRQYIRQGVMLDSARQSHQAFREAMLSLASEPGLCPGPDAARLGEGAEAAPQQTNQTVPEVARLTAELGQAQAQAAAAVREADALRSQLVALEAARADQPAAGLAERVAALECKAASSPPEIVVAPVVEHDAAQARIVELEGELSGLQQRIAPLETKLAGLEKEVEVLGPRKQLAVCQLRLGLARMARCEVGMRLAVWRLAVRARLPEVPSVHSASRGSHDNNRRHDLIATLAKVYQPPLLAPNALHALAAMADNAVLDSARGCLLGQCLGDALGAPFELARGAANREWLGLHEDYGLAELLVKFPRLGFTDDTEMAISVAQALASDSNIDQEQLYILFSSNYLQYCEGGYGGYRPREGTGPCGFVPWEEVAAEMARAASKPVLHATNGAAMRAAVCAFAVAPRLAQGCPLSEVREQLVRTASRQALVTHPSECAAESAAVVAYAAAYCLELRLNQRLLVPGEMLESVIEFTRAGRFSGHQMARPESTWDTLLDRGLKFAESADVAGSPSELARSIKRKPFSLLSSIDAVGSVCLAVTAAAMFGVLSPSDGGFEKLVMFCIRMGADTDTVCAMACAVYASFWGYESVVAQCVVAEVLERTNNANYVLSLAERLIASAF